MDRTGPDTQTNHQAIIEERERERLRTGDDTTRIDHSSHVYPLSGRCADLH